MNSRSLIKRCFNCKHNTECWELNREITPGKDARSLKIRRGNLIKFILKWKFKNITEMEYYCIRTMINSLNPDMKENVSHKYTMQTMCFLEAMSNASNDFWTCPGDDDENPRDFIYESIGDN